MKRFQQVPVWDPLVRVFHWSLVLFFALAWLTGDDWLSIHMWAGYTVASLVAFRLVWGVIGTRHARFTDFVFRLSTVKAYLSSLLTRHPKHYLGHNPAGGLMVVLLLISLAALTFTGMIALAQQGEGVLANTLFATARLGWVEEIHEVLANGVLLLVFVHVAGVLVSSLLHRENLVRAMITGRKTVLKEVNDEI